MLEEGGITDGRKELIHKHLIIFIFIHWMEERVL